MVAHGENPDQGSGFRDMGLTDVVVTYGENGQLVDHFCRDLGLRTFTILYTLPVNFASVQLVLYKFLLLRV